MPPPRARGVGDADRTWDSEMVGKVRESVNGSRNDMIVSHTRRRLRYDMSKLGSEYCMSKLTGHERVICLGDAFSEGEVVSTPQV